MKIWWGHNVPPLGFIGLIDRHLPFTTCLQDCDITESKVQSSFYSTTHILAIGVQLKVIFHIITSINQTELQVTLSLYKTTMIR